MSPSHCAILHDAQKEEHLRISTVLPRVGLSGLLSHRLPVALPGFWKTLRSYITSLQNSTIWFQNTFALLSLLDHNGTLWLSSQDLRQNPSPKCLSTTTSPKPSPQLLNNTLLHNSLIQSLPATARTPPYSRHPASTSWFFDNTSFRTKDWGWTLSNNEPNTLPAVL